MIGGRTVQGIQSISGREDTGLYVVYRTPDGIDHDITIHVKDRLNIRTVGDMADYIMDKIAKEDATKS